MKIVLLGLENIERDEFAISALHVVFHFARYGSNVAPIENGKKLRLYLGGNRVTLYRLGDSFLLGHKGTANPIAERCTGVTFASSEGLLTTSFVFGDKVYVLQVAPGYFTR
ncbi:MAG: hypothetical protein ABDK87_03100 [Atribacterota bacterium]